MNKLIPSFAGSFPVDKQEAIKKHFEKVSLENKEYFDTFSGDITVTVDNNGNGFLGILFPKSLTINEYKEHIAKILELIKLPV